MTIDELIDALNKAEGPSRELNRGIAISLGWAFDGNGWQEPDGTRHSGIDEYTSSLDAAMTLADDFESVSIEIWTGSDGVRYGRAAIGEYDSGMRHPAIALCLAALKARRNA